MADLTNAVKKLSAPCPVCKVAGRMHLVGVRTQLAYAGIYAFEIGAPEEMHATESTPTVTCGACRNAHFLSVFGLDDDEIALLTQRFWHPL